MIDIHTHILPGMDDGARDPETSLELLRMERNQGVDRVVFTPHFHRDQESPERFLARRQAALNRLEEAAAALPPEERASLPRWELGAEVAWVPNLADREELNELCLGRSRYFLLELPVVPWGDQLISQLYDLVGRGRYIPVIAHLDRYWDSQRRERLQELFRLGVPIQMSAQVLLNVFSRRKGLRMLAEQQIHLIASDCHSPHSRPPNLGPAMDVVERRLGPEGTGRLRRWTEEICPLS